jgi:hypothetical protein
VDVRFTLISRSQGREVRLRDIDARAAIGGVNVYGVSEHKGTAVAGGFFTIVTLCAVLSEARTTRIEITRVVPAFEGQMFGDVGP